MESQKLPGVFSKETHPMDTHTTQSHPVRISWIIATRNRLPFLQYNLEKLTNLTAPDEEIIVVDGNSTDGSTQYLQQLLSENKIQKLITGKDRNQAHAWNKALLFANGKYIKKIIDDDIFDHAEILKCISYMENNPEADICISEDLSASIIHPEQYERHSRKAAYEKWVNHLVPSFTFGDVHMIIRRSSLALIGLYDCSFIMIDYEFSLRISYLKANIVFYTGCNALTVSSPYTITSNVALSSLKQEAIRANTMYAYAGDSAQISNWSKIKIRIGKLRDKYLRTTNNKNTNAHPDQILSPEEIFKRYDIMSELLQTENQKYPGKFFYKKNEQKKN